MNDETPDPSDPTPPSARKPDGWEVFCSGILRTEFGRRPSRAVNKAMMQLTAEEALAGRSAIKSAGWLERIRLWLASVRPRPALAIGFALILIIGVAALVFGPGPGPGQKITVSHAVCVLSDAMNARWANNSVQPTVGDQLAPGSFYLESGVVELTFSTASKVAVEGPATFTVTGENSIDLKLGKISTYVPRRGRGFTVNLPLASVVDLGTRFGAMVGKDQSSEVDIFQGKVKLTPIVDSKNPGGGVQLTQGMAMFMDNNGAVAATALSEMAFPQPGISVLARPQNCGFDVSDREAVGEVPVDFGYWSGPAYSLTGSTMGVNPVSGPGMLQFFDNTANPSAGSEVWQLVDMHSFKKMLAGGQAEVDLSAFFNRIPGDLRTGKKFGLTLAAFRGSPADAKTLWATRGTAALALADKELTADDNPGTWEKLAVSAKLPPETDFVIVEIRAIAPKDAGIKTPMFPGNFADKVDMRISTPMMASSITTSR